MTRFREAVAGETPAEAEAAVKADCVSFVLVVIIDVRSFHQSFTRDATDLVIEGTTSTASI